MLDQVFGAFRFARSRLAADDNALVSRVLQHGVVDGVGDAEKVRRILRFCTPIVFMLHLSYSSAIFKNLFIWPFLYTNDQVYINESNSDTEYKCFNHNVGLEIKKSSLTFKLVIFWEMKKVLNHHVRN